MFDRLFDIILQFLDLFRFWEVVDQYERGIVLRLGKFQRELDPGVHLLIPFGVDRAIKDNVVPRTMNLGAQSLTTADGVQVVIGVVVTARIHDIQKSILEVETVDEAVVDACYAETASVVHGHTWEQLQAGDIDEKLRQACRKRAWSYGVEIMRTQISDLSRCRSLRLWTQS